ncbi:MAG: reverse transcriptase domain-containing protein, partial [bacterium]
MVAWSAVRLILALSSMLGLQSRQVDFTQAFTQSPIDADVYMRIPQGWFAHQGHLRQHPDPTHRDASHFIRLAKTLYGVKQAARQWHAYIHQG